VKIAFEGEGSLPGEWMWVCVDHCDEERQLIFGTLDNEPVVSENVTVGNELAISHDKVREHRKPWEFTKTDFQALLFLPFLLDPAMD
jgi:uncharacterized protein YegJ (DUF2314 family)